MITRRSVPFHLALVAAVAGVALLLWLVPGSGAPVGPKEPPAKSAARPYGIDRRLPLTTSAVAGSPDPPPPYRVKKVFPELNINFPVAVVRQPGSDRLIYCTQTLPYSATAIWRMKDFRGSKTRPGAPEV